MAILAACTVADMITIQLSVRHPPSRSCLFPQMMITYDTTLIACSTTANDIRNPTDRHIEQKYRSRPWQSCGCGKSSHVFVIDEQRRWRP